MALFFDQKWFTERLNDLGRTPNELAEAMNLPLMDLAAVWKDQRELSVEDVRAMAEFLRAPVEEVASHAGISTPIPSVPLAPSDEHGDAADLTQVVTRLDEMSHRLDRLERSISDIKALLLDQLRSTETTDMSDLKDG